VSRNDKSAGFRGKLPDALRANMVAMQNELESAMVVLQRAEILESLRQASAAAPRRRVVDLKEELERSLALIRPIVPPSAQLDVSLDPGLANVFADPAQLHHVLLALCSHAAAAIVGPHGRIGVTAVRANVRERTRRELGLVVDGPHALIAVADNGARPNRLDVEAIFKCEASGLGVVREIVRHHYGALHAHSGPVRGTCFSLWLPTTAQAAEAI